jgi:hypothetical protein
MYRQKSWENENEMMLATIASVTLCTSVFAWTGYDTGFGSNTDNSTWQVSARVTGYYWTAGQYEEVLFQARKCELLRGLTTPNGSISLLITVDC